MHVYEIKCSNYNFNDFSIPQLKGLQIATLRHHHISESRPVYSDLATYIDN